MNHRPRSGAAALLLSLLALAAPGAARAGEPTPRDLHAARCVAALEVLSQDLAAKVRGGDEAARAVLMDRLVAGASFIGDTYLHSDVNESQAKQARQHALEAQKKLPAAELAARQAACAQEGSALYSSANGFQQIVVRRLATKRMNKLLGTPG